jgi:hypothetical protein
MLNSKPNSNLNICTCSTSQDLHIYVMKSAKGDDEFEVTLEWKLLNSRSQVLKSSRSSPLYFLWSFKQEAKVETTWILLNLKIRSTWGSSWSAWFLDELLQVNDESCSELHQEQEYAKRFEVCVKKIQIRSERKWREFWNFRSQMLLLWLLGLGFGFYMPC